MKVKTTELEGPALDWAVARCEGHAVAVMTVEEQRARWFEHVDPKDLEKEQRDFDQHILPTLKPKLTVVGEGNYKRTPTHAEAPMLWGQGIPHFAYGTSWAQGGPILDRMKMDIKWVGINNCRASIEWLDEEHFEAFGPTPLVAANRCFVLSRLGAEVDVPDELMDWVRRWAELGASEDRAAAHHPRSRG